MKIRDYNILTPFKGAGQSMYAFAKKGTKEFFIKKFINPKYPVDGSPGSEKTKRRKREKCKTFEDHHNKLFKALKSRCGAGGNLIVPIDFFRNGAIYYKVYEKVDTNSINIEGISKLPANDKMLILKTIAHSLSILHNEKIVHGDLKLDNILIKKKKGGTYISKLIDFDSSYFSKEPPAFDETVGDQVYYSPELAEYILSEGAAFDKTRLTTASDIFSLGLIFHQIWTGDLPLDKKHKLKYCWQIKDGENSLEINKALPPGLHELIKKMVSVNYEERPTIKDVFSSLKTGVKETDIPEVRTHTLKPGLRINVGGNAKSHVKFHNKDKDPGKSTIIIRIGKSK